MIPARRSSFASPLFRCFMILAFVLSACSAPAPQTSPTAEPAATATATAVAPAAPVVEPTQPAPADSKATAPQGDMGQTYYAAFPVKITLDGDTAEWKDLPVVILPQGADPGSMDAGVSFAAAADDEFLYLMGDVVDSNIISGKHDVNYWNEDSLEFYLNATGDLGLTNYVQGVAQLTVPALNAEKTPETAVIAGVNGPAVGARLAAKKSERGWTVEVAVPLKNSLWSITPAHGQTLGFQVHLNGASEADRNLKLIWSWLDGNDTSYQNPSVFGQLIFYQNGATDRPVFQPTPAPAPTATLPAPEASAPYANPSLSVDERVDDLLQRMSLPEKLGQMTLVEKNSISFEDVGQYFIGGVLSGGGGFPSSNTVGGWFKMVNRYQRFALQTRLNIPMIYGVDAVHGHNNLAGAVIFPHQIGLGAANDPELMERIGRVTAEEMAATGIYWNYAPVVAVPQDIRWGRTYEGYGENTDLVTSLSVAFLKGLQGDPINGPASVMATPKHYIGDGGTTWGSSTTNDYKLDQGVTNMDEATLRQLFLPPYKAVVDAGALTIMTSFSSYGGMKMHAQKYLVQDVLKGELGFKGFVVSDWGGIDQISSNYYDSVVTSINAGVDMNMVPTDYKRFLNTISKAVEAGDISMERIDDAVRRILWVKFAMGLFEHPYANNDLQASVGSAEHRAVAREAVAKSAVLLKNENQALPLAKDGGVIYVAGVGANDIGMQSGGWTIEWQGKMGEITTGTTIYQAISGAVNPGPR